MSMPHDTGLRRGALLLAIAGGVEYGLQLLAPVILVRCLDETTFGEYRLLWLMAATAFAIAPAFMPQSLFFFVPRADAAQRRIVVGNVAAYLVAAGCVVGVAAGSWNPWLQGAPRNLALETGGVSALFLAVSVMSGTLDVLPTADGRPAWQAGATIALAALRAALLMLAAWSGARVAGIACAMLVVAVARIMALAWYLRRHVAGGLGWDGRMLKAQLAYALPFAAGNALFLLRAQADQWVVASMLPPALFASFSIAAVVLPVATLVRQPVYNAMMPRLNRAHARGDAGEAARLIARSNGAAALLLVPLLGAMFAGAPQLVDIIYTARYRDAAPIMQVYLLGMMMNVFAVGHVLPALDQGRFAAFSSAGCLAVSVALSMLGVMHWGPIGAAFGSVLTLALAELLALRVVARSLGKTMCGLLDWSVLRPTALATAAAVCGATGAAHGAEAGALALLLFKCAAYTGLFIPCFLLAGGMKHLGLLMRSCR
jgi:O-antigen/teichoic acid export membrane protein